MVRTPIRRGHTLVGAKTLQDSAEASVFGIEHPAAAARVEGDVVHVPNARYLVCEVARFDDESRL